VSHHLLHLHVNNETMTDRYAAFLLSEEVSSLNDL